MELDKQLEIIKQLGLGKRTRPTKRIKWTEEHELAVLELYKNGGDVAEVAETIGHSVDSVNMKLANIKSIISGNKKGLSHISKLTIDIVKANL